MSARAQHESAAAQNAAVARSLTLAGGDALVWVPTLWFYAGVQLVEAALADYGEHLKEHGDRLGRLVSPLACSRTEHYRSLQILSTRWRYYGIVPTAHELAQAERWAQDLCADLKETWPT